MISRSPRPGRFADVGPSAGETATSVAARTRGEPAVIEALRTVLAANAVTVRGPMSPAEALAAVAGLAREARGVVAISPGDALVEELGVVEHLADSGLDLLLPDAPDWRERLPAAAIGITSACLAVAETGSLAHLSGPGAPRAVSLLPPTHVCLVATRTIVSRFADAIARFAAEPRPAAITWIGGPSRTGDLEMITTLGVHGPARVDVLLVDTNA